MVLMLLCCGTITIMCYNVEHELEGKETDSVSTGSFITQSLSPGFPNEQNKDKRKRISCHVVYVHSNLLFQLPSNLSEVILIHFP